MAQKTLDELFRQIFAGKKEEEFDKWFLSYCTKLKDPATANRTYSYRRYLLELTGIEAGPKKAALDAGCGFGPNLLSFHLMGFGQIYGIDIFEPMINTVHDYLPQLGLSDQIHVRTGDVTRLSEYYPKDHFDVILSNEALSHYHSVEAFLKEAVEVLKPGGALIISDNNNGANPKHRKLNREIWERFEKGPAGKVHIHTVSKPYVEMRADIARKAAPSLSEKEINEIAVGTFLKNEQQVIEATRAYIENGVMPPNNYRPDICPLEPFSNQVMENLLDPKELCETMDGMGYRARALAYFGGATRGGVVLQFNRLWQAFSPITLRYSNAFILIAHKR